MKNNKSQKKQKKKEEKKKEKEGVSLLPPDAEVVRRLARGQGREKLCSVHARYDHGPTPGTPV